MEDYRCHARFVVVALSIWMMALPAQADRLYFTQSFGDYLPDHAIASVRTNGSGFYEIYRLEQNRIGPLAVDSGSRRLYWHEKLYLPSNEGDLLRSGDATDCRALQLGDLDFPDRVSIALDADRGKIYWTEESSSGGEGGTIKRANLDFSSVEVLLEGLDRPSAIATDPPRGGIYWYERGSGTVRRANLDGSNVEDQFTVSELFGLQIDPAAMKIYYVQHLSGLHRTNFDGSNTEQLAPQVEVGFVVDPDAGWVYFTTGGVISPPRIIRANLDGTNEVIIWEGDFGSPHGIVLDPSDNLITIECGVVVPAVGMVGLGILVLLLLGIGARFVLRSSA